MQNLPLFARIQGRHCLVVGGGAVATRRATQLLRAGARVTVVAPEFAGMTFHEVVAKSALNHAPSGSAMPFSWTVNPYRGCSHRCVYCFARQTHTYLDLDAGHDFDSKIVVKVNAPEVLRRELGSPRWAGHSIAMGTNVDCYQRAEGRYRLMPGIIGALADWSNPFSILTKGTLIYDREKQELVSRGAGLAYPIRDGIPIMLVDEARQLTDDELAAN